MGKRSRFASLARAVNVPERGLLTGGWAARGEAMQKGGKLLGGNRPKELNCTTTQHWKEADGDATPKLTG